MERFKDNNLSILLEARCPICLFINEPMPSLFINVWPAHFWNNILNLVNCFQITLFIHVYKRFYKHSSSKNVKMLKKHVLNFRIEPNNNYKRYYKHAKSHWIYIIICGILLCTVIIPPPFSSKITVEFNPFAVIL